MWREENQFPTFAEFMRDGGFELSEFTQRKHLIQAGSICTKCELDYPLGKPPKVVSPTPPKFSDKDFLKLMNAFNDPLSGLMGIRLRPRFPAFCNL